MENKFEKNDYEIKDELRTNFEIAEKNEKLKNEVFKLSHQYPDHFIPGLFEKIAEPDFENSDIMVAVRNNQIVGCLMFDRQTKEFNWLAVSKEIEDSKAEIAKKLFENFYPTIEPGTSVHLFVNTEDAHIPGQETFSGKNFEPARKLYRSMGWDMKEENIIKDYYGEGAHVYKVEWKIK